MLRWISPVVEQHKKTLVPGIPQLNMCDVAVMVRFTQHKHHLSLTFTVNFAGEIAKRNSHVVETGFVVCRS